MGISCTDRSSVGVSNGNGQDNAHALFRAQTIIISESVSGTISTELGWLSMLSGLYHSTSFGMPSSGFEQQQLLHL